MAEARLGPGDRVVIVVGVFARMAGTVTSPAEIAARWPDIPASSEAERGDAVWVVAPVFERDIPALLAPSWVAAG